MAQSPTPMIPKLDRKIPLAVKIFLIFFFFAILPGFLSVTAIIYLFQQKLASALATHSVTVLKALPEQFLAQIIIFSFFLAVASILGTLVAIRLIVSPAQQVRNVVQELAKGRLSIPIEPPSNDEFGETMNLLKYLVKRILESREREQAVNRAKTEFISIAAHQLRTPLSSTKWVIRLLLDGDAGDITQSQRELLEKGYSSNETMIELVRDLLDASRIEEGRFGYVFEETNMQELVTKVVKELTSAAEARNLHLVLEISKDLPRLLVDPQRLSLALQNLVSNAINYTPPKGTVMIHAGREGNFVKISVSDTGVGIPAEDLNRIFTKFFRAANVVRMQTQGSGLGLFIVKNVVLRHGGDISVQSKQGKGSVFTMSLPTNPSEIPIKEQTAQEHTTF